VPKQKRWDLKRKCDYLNRDLERALYQCQKLWEVYHPNYPMYYPFISTWVEAIHTIQESVSQFKEMI